MVTMDAMLFTFVLSFLVGSVGAAFIAGGSGGRDVESDWIVGLAATAWLLGWICAGAAVITGFLVGVGIVPR